MEDDKRKKKLKKGGQKMVDAKRREKEAREGEAKGKEGKTVGNEVWEKGVWKSLK